MEIFIFLLLFSCLEIDNLIVLIILMDTTQILQELDGDVDSAIEFLTAGHATNGNAVEHDDLPFENDIPSGNNQYVI